MSGPSLPTPDGVPPSGWPGGGGYQRFRPVPQAKEELGMMPSMSRCPICHESIWNCRCRRGQHDVSFDLWCVPEVKIEKKPDHATDCKCHEHQHNKRSLLLTTDWEDVAALWCENLITLGKYKKACEMKDMKVIKNKTMHDYILTRLDNIEGCYSCLFLNGKMNGKQYQYFENIQASMKDYLGNAKSSSMFDDQLANVGMWSSVKLFDQYLSQTLNSEFFKENDIRIENRSF